MLSKTNAPTTPEITEAMIPLPREIPDTPTTDKSPENTEDDISYETVAKALWCICPANQLITALIIMVFKTSPICISTCYSRVEDIFKI
jgi:hypothetical protein